MAQADYSPELNGQTEGSTGAIIGAIGALFARIKNGQGTTDIEATVPAADKASKDYLADIGMEIGF
jgi:hypothetical protein